MHAFALWGWVDEAKIEDNCIAEIKYGCFQDCTGLIGPLVLTSSLQNIGNLLVILQRLTCHKIANAALPSISSFHPKAFDRCLGMTEVDQAIEKYSTSFEG
jgi:hypothetical protein